MKKIFVLILRGGVVGDSIKESSLFEYLKEEYPDSHLAVSGSSLLKEIHKNSPHIDEFVLLDELNPLATNISKLNKAFRTLKAMLRCVKRIKGYDICITTQNKKYPFVFIPKIAMVSEIVRKKDLPYKKHPCKMYFDEKETSYEKYLKPGKSKKIAMNIESKDAKRCWNKEKYKELTKALLEEGYKVYLLGTDSEYNKELLKSFKKDKLIDLIGKTNIRETAQIIKEMDFYVGNDSGLTHIAAAVNTSSVTILIDTDTDVLNDPKKSKAIKLKNPDVKEVLRAIKNEI